MPACGVADGGIPVLPLPVPCTADRARGRNPRSGGRTADRARRAGRSAHNRVPAASAPACDSRTISRNRRRTRLRSAELPTFLETVNPTRTGPSSRRSSACSTNPLTGALEPVAAARKSARCRSRSMDDAGVRRRLSGAQPLAAARAAGGKHLAATRGLQAVAKAMTALAHQLAGLVGPLHEFDLRSPSRAAYTEARQGRQCDPFRACDRVDLPQISDRWLGRAGAAWDHRAAFLALLKCVQFDPAGTLVAELLTPDLCVIGAGAAGLSLAAAAAALGVPVVLIEKGRMGGEHLNYRLRAVEGDDRGGQARRDRSAAARRSASRPTSPPSISPRSTTTSIASSMRSRRTIPRSASPGLAFV